MPRLSRERLFTILEFDAESRYGRTLGILLSGLILLNVFAVVLESVPELWARYELPFTAFEVFSVAIFTIEYVGRFWSCTADPRYADGWRGRLRYFRSPMAVIDLLAILPTYLMALVAVDLRFLRGLRLLRVLKMTRYNGPFRILGNVVYRKRGELTTAFLIMIVLLVLSSSLMYYVEHPAQPDAFRSIPHAMWWSIATLTTVGYGDVTPITTGGRFLGAVTAVLGVGLFALPAGLLAGGFSEALARERTVASCPHCGNDLGDLK